ncbi:hypothetical protein ACF5W4_07490 [Bacillota bacterium Lsc_1132]
MKKVKDLFVETKKVVKEYKKQAEALEAQEQELKLELSVLHSDMNAIFLDMETADLSDKIYLKMKVKEITSKAEIIETMLEELAETIEELKLQFVPLFQQALREDRKALNEYEVTSIAEKYRYLMLTEIADLGKQMQSQYREISPDIYEVFEDQKVREEFPRLEHSFHQDQYRPFFSWFEQSVVSKNEVLSATRGNLPEHLKTPKDVK